MTDAVVVGAGPNGLVAANVLADAGWDVVVLEANAEPGGAVRTAELTVPGFRHDLFSAFYPLGAASPVMRELDLAAWGLRWARAPLALAHPTKDGPTAILGPDVDATARSLDGFVPGAGAGWHELWDTWERFGHHLVDGLLRPFPPVRSALRLAAAAGPSGLASFARFVLLPARRMAAEAGLGEGGGLLLAGNALHVDIPPESTLSGLFGWVLAMLGHEVGNPAPEGGAGALTDALVRRLQARGGQVVCGARVVRVVVRDGRAVAVVTSDGREVAARRAVLADVAAPALYLELLDPRHVPGALVDAIARLELDHGTVKVDWALDAPIPWSDARVGEAGVVHVGPSVDVMSESALHLAAGRIPSRPFLVVGQMTTVDPTRSPPGTETAWAYTHVPQRVRADAGGGLTGAWDSAETEAFAERVEDEIEALAPGFRNRIVGRHVYTPRSMEEADANLVGGAVNGGTAQLHQQLVFRPTPGAGRATTPVRGLYLASASAHPGGGVHGACGANAAHAALAADRRRRRVVAVGTAAGALALARRRSRR